MEIFYTHYEAGYFYTSKTKVYGLRTWKRFVRKNADSHGSYTLSHKGKVIRLAYGFRVVVNGEVRLFINERAV